MKIMYELWKCIRIHENKCFKVGAPEVTITNFCIYIIYRWNIVGNEDRNGEFSMKSLVNLPVDVVVNITADYFAEFNLAER